MKTGAEVIDMEVTPDTDNQENKTAKRFLKDAEKQVRKLDNILSDLVKTSQDLDDLVAAVTTESKDVSEKDFERFNEMASVTSSVAGVLYHLTARMARKYAGKTIEPIDQSKRKALKKL